MCVVEKFFLQLSPLQISCLYVNIVSPMLKKCIYLLWGIKHTLWVHLTVSAYGCNPKKCWSGMDFNCRKTAQKERQWTYLYSCLMFSAETFYCSKIILWYITSMNKIIWSIITNKITVHRRLIQVIKGISYFHFVLKKHNPIAKKEK